MTKNEMTTKFKPLGFRVLLKHLKPEESLKGGIILPDSAKKKQEKAKVIAIGTGKKDKEGRFIEFPVQVNDTVLIEKYAGQEVKLDDEDYVIAKADDIIAVIQE